MPGAVPKRLGEHGDAGGDRDHVRRGGHQHDHGGGGAELEPALEREEGGRAERDDDRRPRREHRGEEPVPDRVGEALGRRVGEPVENAGDQGQPGAAARPARRRERRGRAPARPEEEQRRYRPTPARSRSATGLIASTTSAPTMTATAAHSPRCSGLRASRADAGTTSASPAGRERLDERERRDGERADVQQRSRTGWCRCRAPTAGERSSPRTVATGARDVDRGRGGAAEVLEQVAGVQRERRGDRESEAEEEHAAMVLGGRSGLRWRHVGMLLVRGRGTPTAALALAA